MEGRAPDADVKVNFDETSSAHSPRDKEDIAVEDDAKRADLEHPSNSVSGKENFEKASTGISSSISPHYNPDSDVIVRAEWIGERSMKNIILSVELATLAGIALLFVGIYWKATKEAAFYLHMNTVPLINLAIGAPFLLTLFLACLGFMRRVIRSNRSGKRWSRRRRRGVTNAGIEQVVQIINLLAFVVCSAYVVDKDCAVLSYTVIWGGFVQWTCWNTIFLLQWIGSASILPLKGTRWEHYNTARDAMAMDLPYGAHWRKLLLWAVVQGLIIATGIIFSREISHAVGGMENGMCPGEATNCHIPSHLVVLMVLCSAGIMVYQIVWIWNIRQGFIFLAGQPYNEFRMGNQIIRLQVRLRGLAIIVFMASMIIYTFTDINSCGSLLLSWLGYQPMQIVMTAIVLANTILMTPKRPDAGAILGVWLQEFAWTEREIENKKEERSSSLPPGTDTEQLNAEPIWCFETAIKLIYWCFLCYDYEENKSKAAYSVDTALSLYDLHSFEMLWEEEMDTKCLIGWNDDTMVISFRGTASMANVASDLKVWRKIWPKNISTKRCWKLGGVPRVHSGFYHAYTANGFNFQLMKRLKSLLLRLSKDNPGKRVRVYVTGHSLGGALATLCAYDVMTHCQMNHAEHYEVSCYTFGAPRTGNHAFAKLFASVVPDTWHIINSDDTVTRAGKFFFLYKRGGHRAMINPRGDLLVRPPYVEQFVHRMPGTGSLRDHYLTSYQRSMMAVLAAQFGRKSIMGGKDGVRNLTQTAGTRAVLEKAGLTWADFERLEREGLSAGLRSTSGLVDCSCGNVSIPSWPRQWVEAFKPCKRAREAATRPAPTQDTAVATADLESGGEVLDPGDGEVCVWPRAIKREQRFRMRACQGTEASTVCTAMKSFRMKGKRAQSTWCDTSVEGGTAAESVGDLQAADVPAEESMDREEVSEPAGADLADLEDVDYTFISAAGDDRARMCSFIMKR
ncbi:hypothetical protein ACKKBG_A36690 [Auxenochlorella protothecoides x Auxenochlorella symbiontica]